MKTLTDTENKQVEMGMAAAKMLADPFFVYVMSEMGNAYVNGIVQSKDEDTKQREGFYHAIKALQDVNATLAHWAQVKDAIVQSLNDNEETE